MVGLESKGWGVQLGLSRLQLLDGSFQAFQPFGGETLIPASELYLVGRQFTDGGNERRFQLECICGS